MTSPSETSRGPLEGESTRLHPAAIGVWVLQAAFSIVAIVVLTGMIPIVGALMLVGIMGTFLVRYLRFRWRLEPDSLVIDEGILVRKRRVIRRDRIQTVDLERGIAHRLMGVVEVRIEAIGAGGTEGQLSAVSPAMAERLRRVLLGRTPAETAPTPATGAPQVHDGIAPPEDRALEGEPESAEPADEVTADEDERVLEVVPPERLVVAGLTGGRVGIAAALVGFLFQAVPETWWTEGMGFLMETTPDPTSVVGLRILGVLVIFALVGGFFLSVVGTVFTHWDFTLSETDEVLGVRRGLFTEHRDTVPFRRIQAVLVEENVVRRLLGLGAVKVIVAGRAGRQGAEGTDLLLPIGSRARLYDLARSVVGMEGEGPPELNRMPWRARSRRYVRAVVAAGLGAAVVAFVAAAHLDAGWWPWAGIAFASWLVPALALAEGAYRGLGWLDAGEHLVVREGVLNRRTCYVRTDRLQVLESTANPFQRLGGLATLNLRIARPPMAISPRAMDMEAGGAASWRESLALRLASRGTVAPHEAGTFRGRRWWLGV
jgi:putative membrane protein